MLPQVHRDKRATSPRTSLCTRSRTQDRPAQPTERLPLRELVALPAPTPPFVHVSPTDPVQAVGTYTTEPVLNSSPSAPAVSLGVTNINVLGVATDTRTRVTRRPPNTRDSRSQPEVEPQGPVMGDHTASSANPVAQPLHSTHGHNGHGHPKTRTGNTRKPRVIGPATPEQLVTIKNLHEKSGHFGVSATYRSLCRAYMWPHMIHHVKQVVASCEICQRWSIVKRAYNPIRSPQAWWPFDIIQYDLSSETLPVTERGSSVLLAAICVLTGFCFLRALPDKKSDTIALSLLQIFSDFGTPRILRCDNDATLVSEVSRTVNEILGVELQTSIPYHPNSLGKAERVIGTAKQCIHKGMAGTGEQWDRLLGLTQLNINLNVKEVTGVDPFTLMFNRPCNMFHVQEDPNSANNTGLRVKATKRAALSQEEWIAHCKKLEETLFPTVRERINHKQTRIAERYERSHNIATREIPVGTLVAIKDIHRLNKNEPPMLAPYTIHEKCQNGGYRVRDKAGGILSRTVPIDHIRPLYHARRQDSIGNGADYYVDFIVDHRKKGSQDEYLLKWVGTDMKTWTSVNDIADYNLIHEYLLSLARIPKTRAPGRDRYRATHKGVSDPSLLDEDLDTGGEAYNIVPEDELKLIVAGGIKSRGTKVIKTKSSSTITGSKGSSTRPQPSITDPARGDSSHSRDTEAVSSLPIPVSVRTTTSRQPKPASESSVTDDDSKELSQDTQVALSQPKITAPVSTTRSTTAATAAVSTDNPRQVVEAQLKPRVSRTGRLLKPTPRSHQ